jgi:Na+-translocating ferredoxin:NAD+ oxidoreductase RnfE subunit
VALALDAGNVTGIGIGVILALIVIGLIISFVVSAIVVRIVVAIAVVVLAFVVWHQRTVIEDHIAQHKCSFSFFGVHLGPPDHLKKICS